jgi:hypothetical protein
MERKDTRMTRRYAQIGPAHLANAIDQLEKSYGKLSQIHHSQKKRSYRKPVTP